MVTWLRKRYIKKQRKKAKPEVIVWATLIQHMGSQCTDVLLFLRKEQMSVARCMSVVCTRELVLKTEAVFR